METGTLGEPREAVLDTLYAEAKQVLSHSANRLRELTERVRESHAADLEAWEQREVTNGPPGPEMLELARGRQLLTRLELAVGDVEQTWLFLERGGAVERAAHGRGEIDEGGLSGTAVQLVARQVLEAQEQERTRIAEELHDGPAQALANASFQVEVVDHALSRDPDVARSELHALRALLERELDRLRGYIHQLRPPLMDDAGLEVALEELAERLTIETGTPVDLMLDAPSRSLDGAQRAAVLRVAQEAMRNVRKHASASRVAVATRLEGRKAGGPPASWVLEVRDDGRGFDVDETYSVTGRRHFGLRFMRERAELVGGRLEIASKPDVGTTVRLAVDAGERS